MPDLCGPGEDWKGSGTAPKSPKSAHRPPAAARSLLSVLLFEALRNNAPGETRGRARPSRCLELEERQQRGAAEKQSAVGEEWEVRQNKRKQTKGGNWRSRDKEPGAERRGRDAKRRGKLPARDSAAGGGPVHVVRKRLGELEMLRVLLERGFERERGLAPEELQGG